MQFRVTACDRCGKVIAKPKGATQHSWIDGSGVCPTCEDELCTECAQWVDSGNCKRCDLLSTVDISKTQMEDIVKQAFLQGWRERTIHPGGLIVMGDTYIAKVIQELFKEKS